VHANLSGPEAELADPEARNSQVEGLALTMLIETRKSVPAIRICKRVVMVMSSFD